MAHISTPPQCPDVEFEAHVSNITAVPRRRVEDRILTSLQYQNTGLNACVSTLQQRPNTKLETCI